MGNFTGIQQDATANFNFSNIGQNVTLGNFNDPAPTNASGIKFNLTANNLAQGLTIGNIGIKESSYTDIHNGSVNINAGITEGVVRIGTITIGADSKVNILF